MFLGIDPGIRKLGFALIDDKLNIIDGGIVLLDEKNVERKTNFERLLEMQNFFDDFFKKNQIKALGMEKLFFTKFNQANAEFVYGVRALVIILCMKKNIKIYEYTPLELKKFITGNGKATKLLMQKTIMKIFGLSDLPKYHDTADALGLAFLISKKNGK